MHVQHVCVGLSHPPLPPVWPSTASLPLMLGGGVSSRCGSRGAKSSVSPCGFSPWAARTGRAAGESHTADIQYVCLSLHTSIPFSLLSPLQSVHHSSSLCNMTLLCHSLPLPSSSCFIISIVLLLLLPLASVLSNPSPLLNFKHLQLHTVITYKSTVAKSLGFSTVVNLLYFMLHVCYFSLWLLVWPQLL